MTHWSLDEQIAAAHLLQQRYGAIAYSPSTERYGWSWRCRDRPTAEQTALASCPVPDAQLLVWGEATCLALAIGDRGTFGFGWGNDSQVASRFALAECHKHSSTARLVLLFDTRHGTNVADSDGTGGGGATGCLIPMAILALLTILWAAYQGMSPAPSHSLWRMTILLGRGIGLAARGDVA